MNYTCPTCGTTWTYEELGIEWYVDRYCPVCDMTTSDINTEVTEDGPKEKTEL